MSRKTERQVFLVTLVVIMLAVASYASAMAQTYTQVFSFGEVCKDNHFFSLPAGVTVPTQAPAQGTWIFQAQPDPDFGPANWEAFRAHIVNANGNAKKAGTVWCIPAEATTADAGTPATATPVPAQPTAVPTAMPMPTVGNPQPTVQAPQQPMDGWAHNPLLPVYNDAAPYPGLTRAYLRTQESDGLARQVEVTVAQDQILVMHGDTAEVPGIGNVSGDNGCYLLIVLPGSSQFVWDTQPTPGERPMITWHGRSSWELHEVNYAADPYVWAASLVHNLSGAYPETCGMGIDVWVWGERPVDVWSDNTGIIGYVDDFPQVSSFAGLCANEGSFLVLWGEDLSKKTPPCDGTWYWEQEGKSDKVGHSWNEFQSLASGNFGTAWLSDAKARTSAQAEPFEEPTTYVATELPLDEMPASCNLETFVNPDGTFRQPTLNDFVRCLPWWDANGWVYYGD